MDSTSSSLQSSLSSRTVPQLRTLCQTYHISHIASMRKADLVASLLPAIQSLERLEQCLYLAREPAYRFFRHIYAADKPVPVIEANTVPAHLWLAQGYVFMDKRQSAVFMPAEIQQMYQQLLRDSFADRKRLGDLMDDYAAAAVHLYGVIQMKDLVQILNQQNECHVSEQELRDCLQRHIEAGSGYLFYQEYLVDEAFQDNDFDDVQDLLGRTEGKPRYLPSRDRFLLYADADYFEETLATTRLRHFFINRCALPFGDANDMTACVAIACKIEAPISYLLDELRENQIHLVKAQRAEFQTLVGRITKTSRLWSLNGYSPEESQKMARAVQGRKIGRNEPCPCGSGLKYKRCCGR